MQYALLQIYIFSYFNIHIIITIICFSIFKISPMFTLSRIQRTSQYLYNFYIGTYVKLLSQNDNILNKIYINYEATQYIFFKTELVIA